MDRHLSPAETARRFGVSIKALRLYEQHGFLKPLRTSNGSTGAAWRVYGSDQLARLHQILALKRLGLSLGQIGELLVGEDELDPILALQERALVEESERITRALALLRRARTKLASGAALSIDDLTALTQETVMTTHSTAKDLNEIVAPYLEKRLTPEEGASVKKWNAAHPEIINTGKDLMEEAKALMEAGDTTSEAAMDFARRYRELMNQMKSNQSPAMSLSLASKLNLMLEAVRSGPEVVQKVKVFGYIPKVLKNLKKLEESGANKKN
jgi:DNA-binding transcriptional MerR regulator